MRYRERDESPTTDMGEEQALLVVAADCQRMQGLCSKRPVLLRFAKFAYVVIEPRYDYFG